MKDKKRILIINPNARAGYFFVPYLWLCFKSHHQEYSKNPDAWEWPEPVSELDYIFFSSLLQSIIDLRPVFMKASARHLRNNQIL